MGGAGNAWAARVRRPGGRLLFPLLLGFALLATAWAMNATSVACTPSTMRSIAKTLQVRRAIQTKYTIF